MFLALKGSTGQSHSSSGSHHPVKKFPSPAKFLIPPYTHTNTHTHTHTHTPARAFTPFTANWKTLTLHPQVKKAKISHVG